MINDEIINLETQLKNKAIKLKALSNNNVQYGIEKPQYVDLGLYKKIQIYIFGIERILRRKMFLRLKEDYRY